jgi:hypothetical protein
VDTVLDQQFKTYFNFRVTMTCGRSPRFSRGLTACWLERWCIPRMPLSSGTSCFCWLRAPSEHADLKTTIAESVVEFEIRNRSPASRFYKTNSTTCSTCSGCAPLLYADHPEGATGMVMKDYRGQKARKEIWKFDAALVASSMP